MLVICRKSGKLEAWCAGGRRFTSASVNVSGSWRQTKDLELVAQQSTEWRTMIEDSEYYFDNDV